MLFLSTFLLANPMKNFRCHCGQQIFFENTICNNCKRVLGYDPHLQQLLSLDQIGDNLWQIAGTLMSNHQYRLCHNYLEHKVCNWLVDTTESDNYCLSCRLTQTIPNLSIPQNIGRWAALESAKRRLIHTLLSLHLPIITKQQDAVKGINFVFIEDQRFNPNVAEEHVMTGHINGTITINLAETDSVNREATRQAMNESYRTLLGHFRHESGHYYWDLLLKDSQHLEEFHTHFGDEKLDYSTALQSYYAQGPQKNWQQYYISAYAQSHPLEDWAESWAHYLHMVDTLDTAHTFNLTFNKLIPNDFDIWLQEWIQLTIIMNSLNRSMGLPDAYPFILSPTATEKLRFIHHVISDQRNPIVSQVAYQTLA